MSARLPATKPPAAPPSALPSVPVMMSTCPVKPKCSIVPRPVLPITPVPCESSTTLTALYFLRSATISGSFASEPSIENTPSVTTRTGESPCIVFELLLRDPPCRRACSGALRLARKAHAVDDRGVVQLVGDDAGSFAADRREEAGVRVPARDVRERGFRAEELRDAIFERAMDVERSADKAHRCRARAVLVASPSIAGFDDFGLIGEPEIVVAREHDDVARFFHVHFGAPSAS